MTRYEYEGWDDDEIEKEVDKEIEDGEADTDHDVYVIKDNLYNDDYTLIAKAVANAKTAFRKTLEDDDWDLPVQLHMTVEMFSTDYESVLERITYEDHSVKGDK